MRLNREKVVAALAFMLFLAGFYRVTVGIITQRPDINVPDIHLPEYTHEIAPPTVPSFSSQDIPDRNLFQFKEGWRPLDTLPLAPPPLAGASRIVPVLGSAASGDRRVKFLYVESLPREVGVRRGGPKKTGDGAAGSDAGASGGETSTTDASGDETATSPDETSETQGGK